MSPIERRQNGFSVRYVALSSSIVIEDRFIMGNLPDSVAPTISLSSLRRPLTIWTSQAMKQATRQSR